MVGALENVSELVTANGKLFIAIYNDQGRMSKYWLKVKQIYNQLPRVCRWLVLWPVAIGLWGPATLRDFVTGRPFHTWRNYARGSTRGMAPLPDLVDWVGGLPFEVATRANFQLLSGSWLRACATQNLCWRTWLQRVRFSEGIAAYRHGRGLRCAERNWLILPYRFIHSIKGALCSLLDFTSRLDWQISPTGKEDCLSAVSSNQG